MACKGMESNRELTRTVEAGTAQLVQGIRSPGGKDSYRKIRGVVTVCMRWLEQLLL